MNRSSAHFILRGLALLFLRYSAGSIVCKPYTWSTVKFEIFSYVLREIILCSKSNFSFDNRCLIWMGRANGGSRIVSDAAAVVPVGQVKGQRQALGHIPPPPPHPPTQMSEISTPLGLCTPRMSQHITSEREPPDTLLKVSGKRKCHPRKQTAPSYVGCAYF